MISFLVGCKKCKSSTYKLSSRACGMRHKKKVCGLDFNLWKSNLNERTILRVRRRHGLGNEEKKNASNNGVCKLHLQLKIELPVGDSGILFESSNHLVSVLITFFSSQNRTVDCILQIWQNHEFAWWMNSWWQKISASLWFLPVSWTPMQRPQKY